MAKSIKLKNNTYWDSTSYSKVLYSNPTGTQSSITLSDNYSNYNIIEVFFRNAWQCGSNKMDVKAGMTSMPLSIIYGTSTGEITFHNANIQFNNNTVSFMSDRWRDAFFSSSNQNVSTTQQIWITKIVGYK